MTRVQVSDLRSDKMAPAVDTLVAMTDAFEGIDRLAEGAPKTDGAPNFRRVRLKGVFNKVENSKENSKEKSLGIFFTFFQEF